MNNEKGERMKANYLRANSPYCGQGGEWTLLEGESELREALQRLASVTEGARCRASGNEASDLIIRVIRDIQKAGQYPYNSTVQREVERRLGVEQQPDNGSPLSWMVYRSQSLAEYLSKIEAGWIMANTELLESVAAKQGRIEMLGQGLFGDSKSKALRLVKTGQGRWFGLPPRARNRGYDLEGKWVREVMS